jgi:hypothetical protein
MSASLKFARTLIDSAEYELSVHREPSGKDEFASFECEDSKGRFFKVIIEQIDEIDDFGGDIDEEEEEDLGLL